MEADDTHYDKQPPRDSVAGSAVWCGCFFFLLEQRALFFIFVKNLNSELLVLFEMIVDVENLFEIWIETVGNSFGTADIEPFYSFLSLCIKLGVRVRLVSETVQIDQISAHNGHLDFVWASFACQLHLFSMLENLIITHNNGLLLRSHRHSGLKSTLLLDRLFFL